MRPLWRLYALSCCEPLPQRLPSTPAAALQAEAEAEARRRREADAYKRRLADAAAKLERLNQQSAVQAQALENERQRVLSDEADRLRDKQYSAASRAASYLTVRAIEPLLAIPIMACITTM